MKKISLFVGILVVMVIFIFVITSEKDEITKIDAETLQNKLENEEITLLDVREVSEYEGGAYRRGGERTTFFIRCKPTVVSERRTNLRHLSKR